MNFRDGTHRRTKGLVWRYSEHSPWSEWLDSTSAATVPSARPVLIDSLPDTWASSSFDLLSGIEIVDDGSTLPDELFDALFESGSAPPKSFVS